MYSCIMGGWLSSARAQPSSSLDDCCALRAAPLLLAGASSEMMADMMMQPPPAPHDVYSGSRSCLLCIISPYEGRRMADASYCFLKKMNERASAIYSYPRTLRPVVAAILRKPKRLLLHISIQYDRGSGRIPFSVSPYY